MAHGVYVYIHVLFLNVHRLYAYVQFYMLFVIYVIFVLLQHSIKQHTGHTTYMLKLLHTSTKQNYLLQNK